MKSDYDPTNAGVLFADERRTQENHPTHRGSAETKCTKCGAATQFWLSAWVKTGSATSKRPGKRFFSFALTPKDVPQSATVMLATPTLPTTDITDEVPF